MQSEELWSLALFLFNLLLLAVHTLLILWLIEEYRNYCIRSYLSLDLIWSFANLEVWVGEKNRWFARLIILSYFKEEEWTNFSLSTQGSFRTSPIDKNPPRSRLNTENESSAPNSPKSWQGHLLRLRIQKIPTLIESQLKAIERLHLIFRSLQLAWTDYRARRMIWSGNLDQSSYWWRKAIMKANVRQDRVNNSKMIPIIWSEN